MESEYTVFPSSGFVIGFQNKGKLAHIKDNSETILYTAGITGTTDSYKVFKNSSDRNTVMVYFSVPGFTHFASHPANELYNLSLSLDDIFDKNIVQEVEEKLALANTDNQRIRIVEKFLVSKAERHSNR